MNFKKKDQTHLDQSWNIKWAKASITQHIKMALHGIWFSIRLGVALEFLGVALFFKKGTIVKFEMIEFLYHSHHF